MIHILLSSRRKWTVFQPVVRAHVLVLPGKGLFLCLPLTLSLYNDLGKMSVSEDALNFCVVLVFCFQFVGVGEAFFLAGE